MLWFFSFKFGFNVLFIFYIRGACVRAMPAEARKGQFYLFLQFLTCAQFYLEFGLLSSGSQVTQAGLQLTV